MNFQMFKLDLEKAEEPEINIHWQFEKKTSVGNLKKQEQLKKQEFQRNIYFCFTDYTKAFDCVDHNKLWKIFKEMEYETTLTASWEIYMQTKKQQLELDIEQQTGSKFEKEYVKAI